jgi:PAS domain S-box-containing protein
MAMKIDLSRVPDFLPGLVWIVLPNGHIDFVNRQWTGFTGLGPDNTDEIEWWTVIHPEDLPEAHGHWRTISASGQSGQMDARVLRFDGGYRRFLIRCSPLFNDDGLLEAWCFVGTDVEDCGRATEIQRQHELHRELVDSIPIPVATTTPMGNPESINRPAFEYFGKSLEELEGWTRSDVVHSEDLERVAAAHADALRSGSAYHVESRLRRADGVYRWFNIVGLPLHNEEGQILRWLNLQLDIDHYKQTEESLRQLELQTRIILDNIATHVSLLDATGHPEFINRKILDYTGKTEAELKTWGATDLVHPEDLPDASATFKTGIATGAAFEIVYRMRRFDGAYRWFHGHHQPLMNGEGEIVQWCVSVHDIDDHKRVQDSLRATEKNLKTIIDTIPALTWSANPDGTADFFNQHYLDYVGMSASQAQGWGWSAAVHPDDLEHLTETWQDLIARAKSGEAEARLRRADGEYRWFLFRVNPLQGMSGQIITWYGLCIDINDRKRVEEALKRSEAFLAEGQHLARMGNLSWRVTSGEIVWSEPLYRIFEYAPGTTVTLDMIASRVHPEDMPLMVDMVERAHRWESDFEYQHRIILPDGSVKYLHLIAHRTGDPTGQTEYIGAVLDITQRRLSEEALERVRSELTQVTRTMSLGVLTASIAHEVNQPLSGIITNASTCLRMLAVNPPKLDGARDTAQRIIRDGNRAADVISRLRALFTRSVGLIEEVDLNDAVREVISLCGNDLQRMRVSLHTDLTNELPLVSGDRVQLQQVVMNLLRNAADAMSGIEDRPRQLVVTTQSDGNEAVLLSVCDTGAGLAPDDVNRIFDAFFTTKSEGMGIGLSVSRTIIESHGGRLWAEANDGPGATFTFVIPSLSQDLVALPAPALLKAGQPADKAVKL